MIFYRTPILMNLPFPYLGSYAGVITVPSKLARCKPRWLYLQKLAEARLSQDPDRIEQACSTFASECRAVSVPPAEPST